MGYFRTTSHDKNTQMKIFLLVFGLTSGNFQTHENNKSKHVFKHIGVQGLF